MSANLNTLLNIISSVARCLDLEFVHLIGEILAEVFRRQVALRQSLPVELEFIVLSQKRRALHVRLAVEAELAFFLLLPAHEAVPAALGAQLNRCLRFPVTDA